MGKKTYLIIRKRIYVCYVYWTLENLRKIVQKELGSNLRKYFKRSRKLLLKSYEELEPEQRE
ncbi:transposase [Caldicellulosiruptor morganii]|uniref:Transposase n=1 Tax=Caldicellulosiruptor morganii TaxID=1387555 RepID=A0ABY7BQ90_9FIRM|nr:transposase [Caldicellulosiruptor morganii]WAM35007.1 transposase [Caldicellulosiruptor morganii]